MSSEHITKRRRQSSYTRFVLVALLIALQIAWLVVLFVRLARYSTYISAAVSVASVVVALAIYGLHENSAFKLSWIIFILALPLMGLGLYLLFGTKRAAGGARKRFGKVHAALMNRLRCEQATVAAVNETDAGAANQFGYLMRREGYPVYAATRVRYFGDTRVALEAMIEDLKRAEKYIFLDYFSLEETAESFGRILSVLRERAAHGVDVRVMYDDIGSIKVLGDGFPARLAGMGIRGKVFNPFVPLLQIYMNNRDHRKLTVIDGKIGYTGGYNLTDRYFNITHPLGQWKDSGVRLEGDAVRTMLVGFLEMWNVTEKAPPEEAGLWEGEPYRMPHDGFVQPYADTPLDDIATGENVYLNLIKYAKHSFYLTTPYLILSDEMLRELCMAAERGVDVRIITPAVPDKKITYRVTRSYYTALARSGVRIYEFTPGFIHSKQTLADGVMGTVGTINFDFRSMYHHFENGVLMYRCSALEDLRQDFEALFPICEEVTEFYAHRSEAVQGLNCLLRLLAPLL